MDLKTWTTLLPYNEADSGKTKVSNKLASKDHEPRLCTLSGIDNDVIWVPLKALLPTEINDSGNNSSVKAIPAKALLPTDVRSSGRSISVSPVPSKA